MSVCGSRTRPDAMSTGSPSQTFSRHLLLWLSGSFSWSPRLLPGFSGSTAPPGFLGSGRCLAPFRPSRTPLRASPAPLVPITSGTSRPRNSAGSPFAASQAFFRVRSGFAAEDTRPASVVLTPL